jgi:hypothetical protein
MMVVVRIINALFWFYAGYCNVQTTDRSTQVAAVIFSIGLLVAVDYRIRQVWPGPNNQWYYSDGEESHGPFTFRQLQLALKGHPHYFDILVWCAGSPERRAAVNMLALQDWD